MNSDYSRIREVFAEAVSITDPEARRSYIEAACVENPALRGRLDALLFSHENAGEFLQRSFLPLPAESLIEGPGTVIGRYKLLQQIGEGGFGIVFMAEQIEPVQRKVALKVIKPGMDTKEVIARFEAERQALALMDHPNVARVLDGGTTVAGRPYFVMDLVKGTPITEFCDQNQLPPKDRLKLFIQICAGLQHAHQKGIIHRDLKPTNVLVTIQDGVPVPKVIDFGIAKAMGRKLTERTLFTRFEQLIGTPAYMSPEQAEWSGVDVDTRSDIYSLGVLLYELLTGTTPFEKEILAHAALDEVRRMIRETDPPTPSMRLQGLGQRLDEIARRRRIEPPLLTKAVRGDLDWIVMKSLEKDRSRRYETANALARDVARHLDGEPVVARPPSASYRTGKFIRRHRSAVAASTAGLIGLGVLVVGAFLWQARQTHEARRLAEENRRQVARYQVASGQQRLEEKDLAGSLPWFAEALQNVAGDPAHENIHRIRLASILDQYPRLLRLFTNSEPFWSCVFSPNGRNLLALSEHGLKVFDVASGQILYTSTTPQGYRHALASWSGDGQRIVVRSMQADFQAEVFGVTDGHEVVFRPQGKQTARLLDTCDGRTGLVAMDDFTAGICDLESGTSLSPPVTVPEKLVSGRLAGDQLHFALMAGDKPHLQVWDSRTGGNIGPEIDMLRSWAFILSQDGSRVCIRRSDYWDGPQWLEMFDTTKGGWTSFPLKDTDFEALPTSEGFQWLRAKSGPDDWLFWNVDTGEQFHLHGDIVPYRFLAFHPDGLLIATVVDDGFAFIVNRLTGEKVMPPIRHAKWAYAAAFSPDGHVLASCSEDRTLRLWDLASTLKSEFTLRHSGPVTGLAVADDGRRLATRAPGRRCYYGPRLWDAVSGRPDGEPFDPVLAKEVLFSHDGEKLLALMPVPRSSFLKLGFFVGQTKDFKSIRSLDSDETLSAAEFTPDGSQIITAPSGSGPLRLWDLASGKVVASFTNPGVAAPSFALSPDGKRLASNRDSGPVVLWDVATAKHIGEVAGSFDSIAFSPDGTQIATGGRDQCARVWAVPSLEPVTPPLFHGGTPMQEKFSPDGKRLLTRGRGTGLKLWDIKTGRLLFLFQHPGLEIPDFSFSKDGKYILSAGEDGTARVWDTATGELVAILPKHMGGVYKAKFSPMGGQVFTAGADGNVRTWKFGRTEYVAQDLKELSELLASARLDLTGAFMPFSPQELLTRYETSRSKHPEMFATSSTRQQALWHDHISEIAVLGNQWRTVIWHLDRALQLDPSLAETPTADELFARRGQARAELGDLSGAAKDFERAVQLDPTKLWHWDKYALLLLASGSHEKYTSACSQALKQFSERTTSTNPFAISYQGAVVDLCCYGPNTDTNIRLAVELIQRAVAQCSKEGSRYKATVLYNTLGKVLYRAGRYADAIHSLQAYCAWMTGCGFEDLIYLSMANSKLGYSDEAQRLFTEALTNWNEPDSNPRNSAHYRDLQSRVGYQMLRTEAEGLLREKAN